MANELTNPAAAALGNLGDLKRHLQTAKTAVKASGQTGILKFDKHGDWTLGRDSKVVTEDDLAAVNPTSFITGFICWPDDDTKWKDGPLDEIEVPLGQPTPLKHTLPAHDGGTWQEMVGFRVRFTEGEFKGQEAKYTATSTGGHNAVNGLMDAVMAQLDNDPSNPVPIVSLSADHYVHKKYGKTYYPVIDVESWVGMDGLPPAAEDEPEGETEPDAAPAKAEGPAAAEPTRRRRRA